MRVYFAAIGRMKAGAERELFARYFDRIGKTGRSLGITHVQEIELPESRASRAEERKEEEAAALLSALPDAALIVALDENGRTFSSEAFAERLDGWRNNGTPAVAFVVGGPDGHGAAMLSRADLTLAFGPMTWPHQIVRALVAEQVYRALTILTGHPYHRV
ncbi:23S rRNA (pseudouridine(1915)-N(3))-methyltransferase RlmH [Stappia sp. F7233]|uniref:Ribosomal RNA large subunit methyltransferase H n=1 Tax=Stappia albiluteola TaxID=2758565 RepID=A0A839ABP7_9HYPH|nr:23S rRNA (pseudouridine(1915)-N(3))-methyltransferase RlmH [Stappia albiluteola]MBA5777043.1 23S rRNA (pseudouridine(1915)-N(3))-methyltransferase RlmH [Stappia albiluteola]